VTGPFDRSRSGPIGAGLGGLPTEPQMSERRAVAERGPATGPAGSVAPPLESRSAGSGAGLSGGRYPMEGWMKLSDFVVREAIVVDLQATGKEDAIREIVGSLNLAGKLAAGDIESVARAILGREELGSTGIGQGVAVPHTRHPTVDRLIGTVALSRRGVEFAALDGDPVDIVFLLISPPNQPGDHLRALENISRHLKDERFVSFLRQAKTREHVTELLDEADLGSP
jgi:PTS system nitrogen regulatory IIA component